MQLRSASGVSALVTAAPLLLSTLHYTREAEMEADHYAFVLLTKSGLSANDFADAMRRFEAMELCKELRENARDLTKSGAETVSDIANDRKAEVPWRQRYASINPSNALLATKKKPSSWVQIIVKLAAFIRIRLRLSVSAPLKLWRLDGDIAGRVSALIAIQQDVVFCVARPHPRQEG